MAAGLVVVQVHPITWQNAYSLAKWQSKVKDNPASLTPLKLARQLWPQAPLEFQADDGKAVALILADLARRDSLTGLDRAALNSNREIKAKAARSKARAKRREITQNNPSAPPFNPGPGPASRQPLNDTPTARPFAQVNTLSPHQRPYSAPLLTQNSIKR